LWHRRGRNPLYLGGVIIAAGVGLMASGTGWFVLVVGMIVFAYRFIGREEMDLLLSQGETYRAYCAAVPLLSPSLLP